MSYRTGSSPLRKVLALLTDPRRAEKLELKTKTPCHQPLALVGPPPETNKSTKS